MNAINRNRQQGAVLILSLLFLLILSIVAVTSVTTTSMEEKMVSNTRQERIAFEGAEAALRTAETWLFDNLADRTDVKINFNGSNGLYSVVATPHSARAEHDLDVADPYDWAANANKSVEVTTIPMFDASNDKPRYLIEYIGRVGDPPLNYADPDVRQFAFRITSIGWGLDTSAHVLLQSTVRMPL